jgi:hypothetical protein
MGQGWADDPDYLKVETKTGKVTTAKICCHCQQSGAGTAVPYAAASIEKNL